MKKIEFNGNSNVISKQVKLHRVKAGLSQNELAVRLQTMHVNMDQQMVSKIEHNKRIVTDYELACICLILNTTPAEILSDFYIAFEDET